MSNVPTNVSEYEELAQQMMEPVRSALEMVYAGDKRKVLEALKYAVTAAMNVVMDEIHELENDDE